jgi:hypothetical protein
MLRTISFLVKGRVHSAFLSSSHSLKSPIGNHPLQIYFSFCRSSGFSFYYTPYNSLFAFTGGAKAHRYIFFYLIGFMEDRRKSYDMYVLRLDSLYHYWLIP